MFDRTFLMVYGLTVSVALAIGALIGHGSLKTAKTEEALFLKRDYYTQRCYSLDSWNTTESSKIKIVKFYCADQKGDF